MLEGTANDVPSGCHALDIGAAPGGWAHHLADALGCCQVEAVDPMPLHDDVLAHPRLSQHLGSLLEVLPTLEAQLQTQLPRFGLCVCDASCPGTELLPALCRVALLLAPGAVLVAVLRLSKRCTAAGVAALEVECSELLGGHFEHIELRFLFGNATSERTLVARRR